MFISLLITGDITNQWSEARTGLLLSLSLSLATLSPRSLISIVMLLSINSGLNFMRMFLSTLFLLCVFPWVEIHTQTQPVSTEIKPNLSVCNQELFQKAENSYNQRRRSSELAGRAERELKEVVANCADYSWYYQAEEYLKIVQEESAEHNFIIARYYWNRFQTGKTKNLGGVSSRLKKITEEYPNYSQIILVNQLLDEVNKARFK